MSNLYFVPLCDNMTMFLQVFIVLELMQGGELLDQIVESQAFSEKEAAEILYTVVQTVNFLHQEGVIVIITN